MIDQGSDKIPHRKPNAGGGAPLTPTATRELLGQLGLRPRKRLGQNFLTDGNVVRKSLRLAEVQPGDVVVEIGPGLGTLTRALLAAGAEVFAVEVDRELAAHLGRSLAGDAAAGRFHLTEGDCVELPLGSLAGAQPFKIVANLPYAVSTPWLEAALAAPGPLPRKMVLLLQREAAERFTAPAGSKAFGAISVFLQSAFTRASSHPVSPACFYPRPAVDSVLLDLALRPGPYRFGDAARRAVRDCFRHRRKQIGVICRQSPHLGVWAAALEQAGVTPNTRPEAIPPETWQQAAEVVGA